MFIVIILPVYSIYYYIIKYCYTMVKSSSPSLAVTTFVRTNAELVLSLTTPLLEKQRKRLLWLIFFNCVPHMIASCAR